MKKYLTTINIVFSVSLSLVVLIAFGMIPRTWAFLFLTLYVGFVLLSPAKRGVDLFLRSIPFFIALPITEAFDNFNIWRVIIILIFFKWIFENGRWKEYINSLLKISRLEGFIKKNIAETLGIVFLIFAAVSILVPIDYITSIRKLIYIVNAALLFVVARALVKENRKNMFSFSRNFAYSGLLVVFFGFVQYIAAYTIPTYVFHYWWGQVVSLGMYGTNWAEIATHFGNTWFSYSGDTLRLRMFSMFPDSHTFPMYVIMTMPAMFVLAFSRVRVFGKYLKNKGEKLLRGSQAWKYAAVFGVINLALILSGTRGIWLASFCALFVAWLLIIFKAEKKFARILVVSFLIFLLMFPVYFSLDLFPQFRDTDTTTSASLNRLRSIADFGEVSNKGRIHIWQQTVEYIAQSPVLGVGLGNYSLVLGEPLSAMLMGASAHNLYLDIASTIGVFGLMAFLWMLFEITRISIKYIKNNPRSIYALYLVVMLFSLAWIAGYMMTDSALYDGRALLAFFGMLGMGVGIMRYTDYDNKTKDNENK